MNYAYSKIDTKSSTLKTFCLNGGKHYPILMDLKHSDWPLKQISSWPFRTMGLNIFWRCISIFYESMAMLSKYVSKKIDLLYMPGSFQILVSLFFVFGNLGCMIFFTMVFVCKARQARLLKNVNKHIT